MADQLEEIKQKIDIVTLISEYVPLKKAGRNFKALCPFHSERTPSFIVSPERQIFHCFSCNAGGDIFGFLMKIENLEFVEALEILAKRAGVKLVRNFETSQAVKVKEKIFAVNHLASEFYHYLLLNHQSGKKALDYILGRGVKKETLETFSLGYAPQMWDGLSKFLTKKGYTNQEMELAGLAIRSSRHPEFSSGSVSNGQRMLNQVQHDVDRYYDRFRGRLMFSLKDVRGNVVGFAGRMIPSAVEGTSTDQAKYINTPETPVYTKGNVLYGLEITKEAVRKENRAIIVEGELDLISSFQAGISNVVAIKGSALTEGQINLLKRYTQNLILALDMDAAGEAACRRGIELADRAGFSLSVAQLPEEYKDPDECARKSPDAWKKAVKEALPVFDYYLNSALKRYEVGSAEGKKKISEEVLPLLARIANPIVQAHYFSKMARVLEVSEEVIQRASQKLAKNEILERSKPDSLVINPESTPQDRLEEYFLAFLLQGSQILEKENWEGLGEFLKTTVSQKIYKLFEENYQTKKLNTLEFIKSLPAELLTLADQAYLHDLTVLLENKKLFEQEFGKICSFLKRNFYKQKLLELAREIEKVEDKKELSLLSAAYQKLAKELTEYEK